MVRLLSLFLIVFCTLVPGTSSSPATAGLKSLTTLWTDMLPRRPAENEDLVILVPESGVRRISLRRREEGSTRMMPLPLLTDLISHAAPRLFGSDGRCVATRDGARLLLRCRPGTSIAGVTLSFNDFRLPAHAALDAQLSSAGSGGFVAQVTAKGADADSPQAIRGASDRLRLPPLKPDVQPQLVILAPRQGGTLILDSLEIVPTSPPRRGSELSAWAWAPDLWRASPSRLVETAQRKGVERLFVTLDVANGGLRSAAELRNFGRLARHAGIKVQAVEGDPRMVLDDGLREALVRARAYAAYQRNSPVAARLAGIQYDIEPYNLPGWSGDAGDYAGWAKAVRRLSEAAEEPVDLVLPFWIQSSEPGARFLDQVAGSISGLTVMSYRTDAAGLTQIAEPLLAWGSRRGKPVRLALEAGPLPDETEDIYRPAATGTIALMEGAEPRIVRLDRPGIVAGARMYRLSHRSVIRGARLSFLGQEDAMKGLAVRAGAAFSAWPTFSGFALHGLDWTVSEPRPGGGR